MKSFKPYYEENPFHIFLLTTEQVFKLQEGMRNSDGLLNVETPSVTSSKRKKMVIPINSMASAQLRFCDRCSALGVHLCTGVSVGEAV